jgi:SAM-dependent MidA family methyltransferase
VADLNLSIHQYPVPKAGVVSRVIGDETILVHPEQGKVKVLNEVGGRIWALSDGSRTIQQIAAELCREYQVEAVEAQNDVLDFIADLVERGLLVVVDQPAGK